MIGLVVGGVASGVGKTTLTLGLIGALRQRGLTVQPFKVGPDYIDPSQHAQAAGRPSRNLDSWLLPEAALRELFARAAGGADVALFEGVMGLFDGRSGGGEIGSTAHVAKLLGMPVLLVVDAAKAARSIAAVVLGCKLFDPDLRIVGVVLNNVGSETHARAAIEPIEREAGLPVLGWLPRDPDLRQEERYLGLVPAAERQLPSALLDRATAQVTTHLDLDRLSQLADFAPASASDAGLFPREPVAARARLALAQDAAFGFYYQDSLDLLAAWGAEIVPFSPIADDALPADVDGVYLGGGFPELFARDLSANASMLESLRDAAERGLPIYGECGGLMYLQEGLVDRDGRRHALAGLFPGWSTMERARLTLGYREGRAAQSTLLHNAGEPVRGHEFHWSIGEAPPPDLAAYEIEGSSPRLEGFAAGNLLGSYVHVHFGSNARLAPGFVEACARSRVARSGASARSVGGDSRRHLPVGAAPDDGRALVVGVGTSSGAPASEVETLVRETLNAAGLAPSSVAIVATITGRFNEPAIVALAETLGARLVTFTAAQLAAVAEAPTPSDAVARHVGAPGVCEPAAILASAGGSLIVTKIKSAHVAVAIARCGHRTTSRNEDAHARV